MHLINNQNKPFLELHAGEDDGFSSCVAMKPKGLILSINAFTGKGIPLQKTRFIVHLSMFIKLSSDSVTITAWRLLIRQLKCHTFGLVPDMYTAIKTR